MEDFDLAEIRMPGRRAEGFDHLLFGGTLPNLRRRFGSHEQSSAG
jgi:hypothetical protein